MTAMLLTPTLTEGPSLVGDVMGASNPAFFPEPRFFKVFTSATYQAPRSAWAKVEGDLRAHGKTRLADAIKAGVRRNEREWHGDADWRFTLRFRDGSILAIDEAVKRLGLDDLE